MCVSVAVKYMVSKTLKNVVVFIESRADAFDVVSSLETMTSRP
jgi:hypothetical protein